MANRVAAIVIIAGLALILFPLVWNIYFAEETPELAEQYVQGSRDDLGVANVVTAVVAAYRGLDTLGEVTVLFAATAGFLDSRLLPIGEIGQLLSAGAIPIIYSVVGLKVGTELVGVVDRLRSQED